MRCPRCRHVWTYTGSSDYYVTCPRCYSKVKRYPGRRGR